MKKEQDRVDDLFKNKFNDPDYNTGYLEDDWDALEQMLDKPAKRTGIVFWLPIMSAAAAILFFLGWFLFKTQVTATKQQNNQVVAVNSQNHTEVNNAPVNNTPGNTIAAAAKEKTVNSAINTKGSAGTQTNTSPNIKYAAVTHNTKAINLIANNAPVKNVNEQNIQQVANTTTVQDNARVATMILAAVKTNSLLEGDVSSRTVTLNPVETKDITIHAAYKPEVVKSSKSTGSFGFAKRPQFALTVIGASELNAANSFGDSESGTNIGLLFSAGIFNKLTITTGANYSVKPYNTSIDNYHTAYTFKTAPSQIEADCRVLDIPINVDYQLYNKHSNKFSIGTGLSSYIMLHESYNYYYSDPTTKGPVDFTPNGTGKYFFGIMNLQATYTRQVNSKVGISIQPYMKIPLANIGYSQVRLQTAGVAVGLNWNINSLTKP